MIYIILYILPVYGILYNECVGRFDTEPKKKIISNDNFFF